MIGDLILKISKNKHVSGVEIAKKANIDTGHLSHIEKNKRTPSHKTLKLICDALEIPYTPISQLYDISLTEEQKEYEAQNHIICDKIPVFNNIEKFTSVPKNFFDATFSLKNPDNSMFPKIELNDYIFVQQNIPLSNKDIGIFLVDDKIEIRKFIVRKNDISLRAENKDYDDIIVKKDSNFYIIGKVIGKCDNNFENFVEF